MAINKNTSNTLNDNTREQLREIADQLSIFSQVLECSFDAVSKGSEDDGRTVAQFAMSRISTELFDFTQTIYELTKEGSAA